MSKMFDTKILRNKTAFVSGATGGIGKEISISLAKCGCNLFLTDVDEKELQNLSVEVSLHNVTVYYKAADLKSEKHMYGVVKKAKELYGSIDIVINSAGVFPNINLFDSGSDDYTNTMNINFYSAFIFTQEFAKDMVGKKWGRVVNIGSSSAYSGFGGTSLYCASKHALLGFSRSIHDELKRYNVRPFCISPSSTQSKMGLATPNQDYNTFIDPSDIARYVVFVISFDGNLVSEELLLKRMVVK